MGLRDAILALALVQGGLEIDEPVPMKVEHAYKWVPPESEGVPQLPMWTNDFTLTVYDRQVSQSETLFTIHSQLFIAEADIDTHADVAAAFLEAFITAMDAAVYLNDPAGVPTTDGHFIRGGNPTLATLTRQNIPYLGLDLFVDLHILEPKTFT